ncbi:MAG: hypothetical protein IPK26_13815 [Planctomycetes bacterium]|nr:hypothetical protein [Planctomycetota bacterium]
MKSLCASIVVFAVGIAAQSPPELASALTRPAERTRALGELKRHGDAGAAAVFAAWREAARDSTAAATLSAALPELGTATAPLLTELIATLPQIDEPHRSPLLRAIANGAFDASDDAVDVLAQKLPEWAAAGVFYTQDAGQPTFAWYEYVRIVRRLQLRGKHQQQGGLQQALAAIRAGRNGIMILPVGFLGGGPAGVPPKPHDLNAFGQHGTREELEAIAELVARETTPDRAVIEELARYLECESPRPGIILTEHCAGIGENAPFEAPEVRLPTLWRRDDWRFAIARVTVQHHPEASAREHAFRHLLHADGAWERIEMLGKLRTWPRPWTGFLPELLANLDHPDRLVVRETLLTLALAGGDAAGAKERLTAMTSGNDREIATLTQRALRALD